MNIKQRLAALEACTKKQQEDREAEVAAIASEVEAWFDGLIVRMEGREPTPDMSWAQQIACLVWTDPEKALRRLTEELEDEARLQGMAPLELQWPEGVDAATLWSVRNLNMK
jgi:hypothetical protein